MTRLGRSKKVILADPRGFCAGVRRAILIVEEALAKYGPGVRPQGDRAQPVRRSLAA
ncbi:hypothetical protein NKG94_31345 [Micromonospora sp. M12]